VADEWYRSSAWGKADEEQFEEKLRRARPHSRPQYIRLKGLALADSKKRRERRAAADLLRRVIREHSDDELQAAMAWADLGRFYDEEGEHQLAAEAYRSCLDAEAALSGGGLHTGSELALAEVIVRAEWEHRYPEALALLDAARRAGLTFKVERWRWCIAHARIAARTGQISDAASFARDALALLKDPSPDFARHPDVGLIKSDRKTVRELEGLAAT
jgi:tetratricopeptide (TPR) repeat protein